MAQMILPGVYITVKDEGLISVGGISVGNVGIVGTAATGENNKVEVLSGYTQAKETFGEPGANLTLVKSLELIFGNGARTVYAVKSAGDDKESYKTALAELENKLVNIVLLAGQDIDAGMADLLQNHISATTAIKRERIALIGCSTSTDTAEIASVDNLSAVADDKGRVIYLAPGISMKKRDPDTGVVTEETLSGAYTAAAFAGLLSSLPVQESPTNKLLKLSGLAFDFNHGQLEGLVRKNVLAVENRAGYRIVKGVTTSGNAAWTQITTRRIVDKAIYGVRAACNSYIGKLNNERVRGAMKATIDGFLTRMVGEEALVGYSLEVSATRAEEIAGRCMVTLSLQPTFSIDYIVVTMYLG
jgi:hypothetical protein